MSTQFEKRPYRVRKYKALIQAAYNLTAELDADPAWKQHIRAHDRITKALLELERAVDGLV